MYKSYIQMFVQITTWWKIKVMEILMNGAHFILGIDQFALTTFFSGFEVAIVYFLLILQYNSAIVKKLWKM